MEFKGTKTEWHAVEYAGFFMIQDDDYYGAGNLLDMQDTDKTEVRANALLISKSPQMLEMLQELLDDLEDVALPTSIFDTISRAKSLIKSATEL